MVQKPIHSNTRARAATPLALAGLVTLPLALAACGYQPSLSDYRPVVDSYNTDMAAYEADRGQCVAVAMQAQAEYERQQRLKRESNMTIGLIVQAIAPAPRWARYRAMPVTARWSAAPSARWKVGWRRPTTTR